MTPTEGLLANCLILFFLVYVAVLNRVDLDFYIYSIQEDESLEWATFWAFLLAFLTATVAAWRQVRQTGRLPWFLAGVGLFCLPPEPGGRGAASLVSSSRRWQHGGWLWFWDRSVLV